jgi:light-regulated signal transduction histidine kinase (bacteriophytochrome)
MVSHLGKLVMDTATETGEPPPSPLDLTTCDREPIHIPGSIQPHGVLFAVSGSDLRITAISANVSDHLGHDPHTLLNAPLGQILLEVSLEAIKPAPGRLGRTPVRQMATIDGTRETRASSQRTFSFRR